jgi:hypothetical protein
VVAVSCNDSFGLDHSVRVALSDTLHIMQQSSAIFKLMVRMMKNPTESQLLSFLRKLKKFLSAVNPGESLLLPAYVENCEMIILLERTGERHFKVVIVQTNPHGGLRHHACSPVAKMPHIAYRTCMVLNDVPKKNILDDIFWMALYNMAINFHENDIDRFYDVLIPFLTGKPLEASLVEAEQAACSNDDYVESNDSNVSHEAYLESKSDNEEITSVTSRIKNSALSNGNCGEWRLPQKSNTAYVRCVLEIFNFLLKRKDVSEFQCKQVFPYP